MTMVRFSVRRCILVSSIALSVLVSGCETTGSKETTGSVAGGVVGALIGTQFGSGSGKWAAIIAGGALGALIGNRVGVYLDERERELQGQATADALATNGPNHQRWSNPDGNSGGVSAANSERGPEGTEYAECRDVEQTLDDRSGLVDKLRFCRGPDGLWNRVA